MGIQPLGSYADNGVDQISLANLGVHVDIPLFQHKGRGSGIGTNIHLVYDSAYTVSITSNGSLPYTDVGWRIVSGTGTAGSVVVQQVSSEFVPLSCEPGIRCNAGHTDFAYNFAFIDPSGYGHPFINGTGATSSRCQGVSPDGCTSINLNVAGGTYDNSGYYIVVNPNNPSPVPNSVIVTAPSGNVYTWSPTGITTMADTNGNNTSGVSNPAYWVPWSSTLTDDSNVSATITGGAYSSSDCTQWTSRAPIQVQYQDTSGNTQTITVNFSQPSNCTPALVDSVVYPDGSSYHFSYQADAGHSLASIQLPTGGTISYATSSLTPTGNGGVGIPATVTRTTPDGVTTYNQTATPCSSPGCIYAVTSATTISKPDGSSEAINFVYVPLWQSGAAVGDTNPNYETAHTWYSASGKQLKSTMRCYNGATGDCTTTPIALPITQISTTTTIGSVTSQTIEYMNTAGLVTEVDEYDFGASSPTRKTVTAYASLGNNIANRPSSVTAYDGSGRIASQTTYGYDDYSIAPMSLPGHNTVTGSRGNQTSQHAWLNTSGGTLDSHRQYDDAGQLVAAKDPLTNQTAYGYDAATDSCLTSVTPPTPSSGVSSATSATCDPNTGLPATATDANGVKTTYSYDSMLRLIGVSTATAQGTLAASMARSYSGASLPETITTNIVATPSPTEISTVILDGLGRTATTIAPNGASVVTTYNSMGYVQSVSNPYFSTSDSTYGITSFLYDGLGRKTYQCQPDNGPSSTICAPASSFQSWSYSGNSVTFTDEAGHSWQRTSDALGRLINVVEPTGASTGYGYDASDNLTGVNQVGVSGETPRARSFVYDSLSRLTSATNPETGTIGYGYDANGNMTSETDARGVTTGYIYDALNRLTNKSSAGASGISGFNYSYSYDNTSGSSGIGRLFGAFNGSTSGTGYYYDAMGRIAGQSYQLPSFNGGWQVAFEIGYDLAGNIISFSYPDGRVVKQTWNNAGLQTVTYDNWNGQNVGYSYLSSATYLSDSSPNTMTFGNGSTQTFSKNSRLQPLEISLKGGAATSNQIFLDKLYCYGAATPGCANYGVPNNGNILGIDDPLNTGRGQGFIYDNLNRLTGFGTGDQSINQGYSYDSFGNMNQTAGTYQNNLSFGANNQINSAGYQYDPAGNLTQVNIGAGIYQYFAYDANNQIVNVNNGAATYTYNANGQRVRKNVGNDWTEYVYFNGQPLAEKHADGSWSDYIYANGQKIARADTYDARIHVSGTTPGGKTAAWQPGTPAGYVIKPNDQLMFRQYDANGYGGLDIQFMDGSQQTFGILADNAGQMLSALQTQSQWVDRVVDLSAYAGKTIAVCDVVSSNTSPAGSYDIYLGDIAIVSLDGSVTPFYNRQTGATIPNVYNEGQTNLTGVEEASNGIGDSMQGITTTTYYLADQIGSSRQMIAAGGWPVSSDTFYPFGQEQNPTSDPNHYKFTGKERDSESGLDYFGARYYASNMGRFMSPDPIGPWAADVGDPQSWNFYAYARNNPLINVDPTGLDCVYYNNAGDGIESVDKNSNGSECGTNGGNWVNGTLTGAQYFSGSDTWGLQSRDSSNSYLTYASAPGTQSDGTTCSGDCDKANGYSQTSLGGVSDVPLNPYAQAVFSQVGQITGPTYEMASRGFCSAVTLGNAGGITGGVAGLPIPKSLVTSVPSAGGAGVSGVTSLSSAASSAAFSGGDPVMTGAAGQFLKSISTTGRSFAGTARIGGAIGRVGGKIAGSEAAAAFAALSLACYGGHP